jgi:hypothetical protein
VIFRDLVERGQGWLAFAEAGTFIVILMAGLVYVWARGGIDWTPSRRVEPSGAAARPAPAGVAREVVGAGAPHGGADV